MKYFFTGLFLLVICSGFAQTGSSQLRFHYLGVKDGLPEGSINVLKKDKFGYLWMGTQNGLVRYDGYTTKVYTLMIRDNINVNVKSLFEDRMGRLWAGTFGNGLFSYNRSLDSFISYEPDIKKLMSDDANSIYQITDDKQGNIWFILINHAKQYTTICSLNPDTHLLRTYSHRDKNNHYFPADNPLSFGKTGDDVLYVGAENGLYQYDVAHDRFTESISLPDSLHNRRVVLFATDNKNPDELWIGAGNPQAETALYNKLILYNTKTHQLHSFQHDDNDKNSLPGKEINSVFCARDGEVWIGNDAGLVFFDRTTQQFTAYVPNDIKPSFDYKEVNQIVEDKGGNIWCVTHDGFLRLDARNRQFSRYTNDPASNNNIVASTIRSLLMDSTGTLWFGAAQQGLQWMNTSQSRFTQYGSSSGSHNYFPGGELNEVDQSKDGTLWLSANNGLYRWTPGTDSFSLITLEKGKPHEYYSSTVLADRDGLIWTRAYSATGAEQGLYSYDPATSKVVNYRYSDTDTASLSQNNIRALLQDENGILWLGTFGGGMCSFDKNTGRFTRYPFINNTGLINREAIQQKTLDDNEVQSLHEDENGTIWAGTNNGSINWFDKSSNRFVPFQKPVNGMTCVLAFADAGSNKLWCGTYTDGLYLVDTKQGRSTHFSEADGLLYNGNWGMCNDDLGNTWITSPRGLSVIQKDKLIKTFTVAGGLPDEPLNFFLFKTKDSAFIYGTQDGFVVFRPDDLLQNRLPPPVVHIEKIVFSKEDTKQAHDSSIVAFGKPEIGLTYNENRITFHYVGLQYQNVSLTRYQYQLEGYEKSWIDAGTQRQITYTNLSPGSYTFRVKAVNSDGVESLTADSIQIIISPPWWKTWWAYLLYFLLLAAGIWMFISYRSKRLTAQNKLLEQRVDERTQQLNQSLTDLKTTQAQLVQSEKMASLGELTAGIAHEIQNPLNFVNNFSEVNQEMIVELQEEIANSNYEEAKMIAKDIAENEQKINHHGKRADAIVKGMLLHSRKNNGQKELTDINALCDEYLRLSYHGMRTKDKSFNAQLQTSFDTSIGNISVVPQDLGRVLLNLFNNAFYAVSRSPQPPKGSEYKPVVSVTTKKISAANQDKAANFPSGVGGVEIIVSDNGNGIPQAIINKIFQPFFTTKPTGEGTGLGLSLSYDIITKEHGGTLEVESKEEEGTTFTIRLSS